MAYRLKQGRPIDKALSRVAAREFDAALEEIEKCAASRPMETVHDARKRIKKIRAILRLVRPRLGEDYGVQNRRLRTLAHQLSAIRDVDAALEIMASVRRHYPRLVTPRIFAAVRRGLMARQRAEMARVDPRRLLQRVARTLRQSAIAMPRQVRRAAGRAEMEAGIVRGYRRARKAMPGGEATPDDTGFHTWRKRLKDHWYHVRLVEHLAARARNRARRLKALETWLGDDHNLVLLRATILDGPTDYGSTRATSIVLGCVEKYHATLRRRALEAGDRLFASRPDAFRESVSIWLSRQRTRRS